MKTIYQSAIMEYHIHVPTASLCRIKYSLIFIVITWTHCAFSQKKLSYTNRSYEPRIKTVQLYNRSTVLHNYHQPAISNLHQQPGLRLEFDELTANANNYYVRIIHCNYKWEPSGLSTLNFIETYNEFKITEYTFSNGTRTPYVHYQFDIPRVKLPGNYLLVVYRNADKEDIIISYRFMIYNNITNISKSDESSSLTLRKHDQQIQFTIDYKGIDIFDPYNSTHLVVRQNQRWDNAKFDIQPSTVLESIKQLYYKRFDEDKYFIAGNEFRFIDFRSINAPGQNTKRIDRYQTPMHLWVQTDKSRYNQAHAQYRDSNGQYYIKNLDDIEGTTSFEYLKVTFTLAAARIPTGNVYVTGAFNQWIQDTKSEMQYNNTTASYSYTTLLKQGWYNYSYILQANQYPTYYFEGSYFETENNYEALFYYHALEENADILIGYFSDIGKDR